MYNWIDLLEDWGKGVIRVKKRKKKERRGEEGRGRERKEEEGKEGGGRGRKGEEERGGEELMFLFSYTDLLAE